MDTIIRNALPASRHTHPRFLEVAELKQILEVRVEEFAGVDPSGPLRIEFLEQLGIPESKSAAVSEIHL